jgi:hypothetical protein
MEANLMVPARLTCFLLFSYCEKHIVARTAMMHIKNSPAAPI